MATPVWDSLTRLRENTPLVHCITNTVAANFAANAVIAVGGSPVMASEATEAPYITKLANALTVNIGTCTPAIVEAIKKATTEANARGLPWVLDPVGVAATKIRQDLCVDLITNYHPAVVRGNASEIAALAVASGVYKGEVTTRGLDSLVTSESVMPAARELAKRFGLVVAISGECDYVLDGKTGKVGRIANGDAMMAQVTATGCSLTAVLGCFLGNSAPEHAGGDPQRFSVFRSVCDALSYYAVAGQLGAKASKGTGTMHTNLLDYLSSITFEEYTKAARPVIDLSVYLVTDPKLTNGRAVEDIVRESLKGGATIVQLREKDLDSGAFLERARRVKHVCDDYGVPLLINDRVDIALAVDAAGVHVGQDDLPVSVVRQLLGPNKVIGLSVSTLHEVQLARELGSEIDYVGVGPAWPTNTKSNAKAALGVKGVRRAVDELDQLSVAIGGITEANAAELFEIPRLNGVAVVTALTLADDPAAAAKNLAAYRS